MVHCKRPQSVRIRYIFIQGTGVIDGTVEVPNGHGDFTLAGQTSLEASLYVDSK